MRLLALPLLVACGSPPDLGECSPDSAGAIPTWTNFGEAFFDAYCQSCHASTSPNRFGAPEGVAFDTEALVLEQAELIDGAVLQRGSMPPGGGVFEEDLARLQEFLACQEAGR